MMRWSSTKTYTEEDIIRMQQEAVNRVHEFQQRAQTYYDAPVIGEPPAPPIIEAESRVIDPPAAAGQLPAPEAAEGAPNPEAALPAHPAPHPTDPIQGLMEKFNLDSETLLILGLMFLLYNEKADNFLLMALAYLLL